MKIVKFLLAFASMAGLTWVLNTSLNIKGVPAPAFGKLLSPFEGFWQNAESLTATPSNKIFSELQSNAKVVYDDRMVPHIFADNTADAFYIQGYLHASNRLFEMDFITRASAGRLSEVLGDRVLRGTLTSVDVDKLMRRKGIAAGAEKTVEEWKKDAATWALIESYCRGANAFISKLEPKNYPIEYKIFGTAPEAWSPLRMAFFAKYMATDLAISESDLQTTNAKILFGSDFDFLFPEYFKEQTPVVPAGTPWNFTASKGTTTPSVSTSFLNKNSENEGKMAMIPFNINEDSRPDPSNGSNNWVVAASKTKDKHPILCGDPHLGLRMPSIWFEVQIVTPEMNVYGVSLPGLPAVIIGFNENIAWTQTNVGHDVADWYSIKWKDKSKNEYLVDGIAKKTETRIEQISVKGKGVILDTVRYTQWGPVTYENDTMPMANMAFHWLANEVPESSITTFVKLNKAKNYAEYAEAIKDFNVPAQNFAFACKDGDIALRVQGMFPIKNKEQGRFLQDGSVSANAWHGFIPKEQIPQYRNPARGFVSSANQQSTDPSYPYFYNSEGFEPYRGRIVNQLLSKMENITIDSMKAMQNNNYSLMAEEALPNMLKNLDENALNPIEKGLLNDLKAWNYHYDSDKVAPIYFEEWFKAFYTATWDEVLTLKNVDNIQKPASCRTVFLLRDEPTSKYFDVVATTDKKETAKDLLTAAFSKMALEVVKITAECKAKYPNDPILKWTHYKDTEIPHISMIPGMGRYHLGNGGQARTINSVKKNHGPSWRMIVEMGDTPHGYVTYPGGQSGNPGSKNYDTFVDKWTKGEYYETIFMKKADEVNPRLTFTQEFKKN